MERWIVARTTLGSTFERAVDVLMNEPEQLLGGGCQDPGAAVQHLEVDVGARAAVGHDVIVSLGAPCSAEGEAWIPIGWEPAAHAQVLPSFAGVVDVVEGADGAELSITGSYQVPLGAVGRFGDGVIGRRLAQQSLQTLVEQFGGRVDGHPR